MRYKAGEAKAYHYLTEIARVSTVGSGSHDEDDSDYPWSEADVLTKIPPITVQLPDDFKGKKFKVFAEPRLTQKNVNVFRDFYHETIYKRRLFITEVYDIDYINASFKIKAYSWVNLRDSPDIGSTWYEMCKSIDLTYTVTA